MIWKNLWKSVLHLITQVPQLTYIYFILTSTLSSTPELAEEDYDHDMPDRSGTSSRLVFKFIHPRIVKCSRALPFTFVFVIVAAHPTLLYFATNFLFRIIQRIVMKTSGIAIRKTLSKSLLKLRKLKLHSSLGFEDRSIRISLFKYYFCTSLKFHVNSWTSFMFLLIFKW